MSEPTIEYKYTTRKNAEAMIKDGIFRIGTLFDFKRTEIHSAGIVDIQEGEKTLDMQGHVIDTLRPDTVPPMIKPYIEEHFIAKQVIIQTEQFTYQSADLYIFTTSKTLDVNIMKKINPKYDTCISIFNVKAFYNALTNCMKEQSFTNQTAIGSDVIYISRKQNVLNDNPVQPHFVKDPIYKYQNEYRTIWFPIKYPIKPILIKCEAAKEFCSISNI